MKSLHYLVIILLISFNLSLSAQSVDVGEIKYRKDGSNLIIQIYDMVIHGMKNQGVRFGFWLSQDGKWAEGTWVELQGSYTPGFDPAYYNDLFATFTYPEDFMKSNGIDVTKDFYGSFFILSKSSGETITQKDTLIHYKSDIKEESAGKAKVTVETEVNGDTVKVSTSWTYKGSGRKFYMTCDIQKNGEVIKSGTSRETNFNQGGDKNGEASWSFSQDELADGGLVAVVNVITNNVSVGKGQATFQFEDDDDDDELSPPDNVRVSTNLTDRIEISWSPVKAAEFYIVERQQADNTRREWVQLAFDIKTTSYVDKWQLMGGMKYNYRVLSGIKKPAQKSEPSSTVQGYLAQGGPIQISSITSKPGAANGGFFLSWNPVSAGKDDWIEIWISDSPNGQYYKTSFQGGYMYANQTSGRTLGSNSGFQVQYDTPYYFKLRVMLNNGANPSEFSAPVSASWPRN